MKGQEEGMNTPTPVALVTGRSDHTRLWYVLCGASRMCLYLVHPRSQGVSNRGCEYQIHVEFYGDCQCPYKKANRPRTSETEVIAFTVLIAVLLV